MALQMPYTAPDGATYPECFIPISYVLAYPAMSTIIASFYANRATFEAGGNALQAPLFDAPTAQLNGAIFANAYAHLLTLPEFAGAVVVPDSAPAADGAVAE